MFKIYVNFKNTPSNQLSKMVLNGVAVGIENVMVGKTIGFVICVKAVAKLNSNNCYMLYRQALPIKQINKHLSKRCLIL